MHVVWGRQLLLGRLPIRDAVSLGMPLQTGLSAAAEWTIGYRLLSEALLVGTAFAAAAALTFVAVRRATASLALAVLAAAIEVAIAPRTYSYPKIVVYAAGILLVWRYVDQPSTRRLVHLGIATTVAFYLRHDHGLYLGVVAVAVIAMRHARAPAAAVRHAAVLASVCVLLTAPYLAYVQTYGSLADYLADLRQFSTREHQHNPFTWPSWPLTSVGSVARWTSMRDRSVAINVRWSPNAPDEARREAAARYQLEVPASGPVESGRFALLNTSTANGAALIRDPAVEDTSGIDRTTGEVRVPGWYVGPVRILEGLDAASASAALLFFAFLAIGAMTALQLLRASAADAPLGSWERVKIAAVLLVGIVTFVGFVREALEARIADAVVAPVVLGAWLIARWLRASPPVTWRRAVRVVVVAAVLVLVGRSVAIAGAVRARLDPAESYAATWRQLVTSPPFDAWPAGGSARYRIVRYVRECTGPREPLLVLWFAPELYYYADRPFAGRLGAYMDGYYTSESNQTQNLAALQRDRPAVAIMEAGREQTDLAGHPSALTYLATHYRQVGELPASDGSLLRVFGRTDREAVSSQPDLGWPCYR